MIFDFFDFPVTPEFKIQWSFEIWNFVLAPYTIEVGSAEVEKIGEHASTARRKC